jgi:hypothetical protein
VSATPPPNPRAGRQRYLLGFLRTALAVTAVCAVGAIPATGETAETLARVMVGLLIAVPVLRVGWLLVRWMRTHDWRFAAAAVTLLAVMATGSLIAR